MDRRIATSKKHAELLDRLIEKLPGESFAIFKTKQKAMMFAAALGYRVKKRTPFEQRDASQAIRHEYFQKVSDDGFMFALAIATADKLEVLADEDEEEVVTIFEEYANTGLLEIEQKVMTNTKPLDALVNLILEARHQKGPTDLLGIDPEILDKLAR